MILDLAGAHSQGIPFPEGLDQAVDGPHTQAEVIAQILTGHAHRYLLPAVDAVFPAITDEKPREFDNAGCNGHLAGGSGRGAQFADQRLDQHLTEPRVNSLPGQEAFHRHSQEQGITLADKEMQHHETTDGNASGGCNGRSITACSSSDGQKSTAEGENGEMVVRVGDFLGETFLYPVKIANAKGFFEEEFGKDNITISIEYLGSGAVMTEALNCR